jgi:hypothetical protein
MISVFSLVVVWVLNGAVSSVEVVEGLPFSRCSEMAYRVEIAARAEGQNRPYTACVPTPGAAPAPMR